ncbi:MAG TPA: hypothetical protein PKD54_10425 [Pirellulaceae bacterium]|nr:hypothetical protein [Pirellulaceae bacterium]
MMSFKNRKRTAFLIYFVILGLAPTATWGQGNASRPQTEDSKPPVKFKVADGALELSATGAWSQVEPSFNMIEAEFKIPRVDQDKDQADGRLTVMGSGGSVQQNIERWYGQFVMPDGSPTERAAKLDEFKVGEVEVHYVDITGTYLDSGSGGPFGPKTERPDYRMLAAILVTPDNGNYFLKFYGPTATVTANEAAFKELVRSVRIVD